jgi:hypothetical protein
MLKIEIIPSGATPRFRITGVGETVGLLTFIVQEAETEALVWVLGPVGW